MARIKLFCVSRATYNGNRVQPAFPLSLCLRCISPFDDISGILESLLKPNTHQLHHAKGAVNAL